MEFKGAKGEWKVGRVKKSKSDFKGGHIKIHSDNHTDMSRVFFTIDGIKEGKANAKLTAASPYLLKALQETEKDLCVLWGQVKNLEETNPIAEGLSSLIQEWRDRNKKAINKALN